MALIQANTNCGGEIPFIGGTECPVTQDLGIILLKSGTELLPTDTFTEIEEKIKNNQLIGTIYWFGGEHANQEAQEVRSATQEMSKRTSGIKGWSFTFDFSICKDNELSKLDRSREYDVLFVNEDGSVTGNLLSNGNIGGFQCYIVKPLYDNSIDATNVGSKLMIELTSKGTSDWESKKILFDGDDFSFGDIEPTEGITFAPVVAVGDTTFDVVVTGSCNGNFISGLDDTTLKVFNDNTELNVTGVVENAGSKTYTITVDTPLIAGLFEIETNDGTYTTISIGDNFYGGSFNTTLS